MYYHPYFTLKEVKLLVQGYVIWVSAVESRLLTPKFIFDSVSPPCFSYQDRYYILGKPTIETEWKCWGFRVTKFRLKIFLSSKKSTPEPLELTGKETVSPFLPTYYTHGTQLAFTHSLIQRELSNSCVPGTWLGSVDTGGNETWPFSCRAHILMRKDIYIYWLPPCSIDARW